MRRSADDVARALAERHAGRVVFTSILEGDEAGDVAFAYRVQDAFVAGLGGSAAGYKVGLTTKRMQQLCGVDEPISGVVLASRLLRSPARARVGDHVRLGLESEIAVRIAPGVTADAPVEAMRLEELVDEACAAFELVEDSGADYARLSAASIVADNSWNAGIVLGPPTPAADLGGLAGRRGVLRRGGEVVGEGSSDEVLGDPLAAVRWLAAHLRARGGALEPGQWVSTGSIVPTRFVAAGERYSFEVDGLAPVEVGFA